MDMPEDKNETAPKNTCLICKHPLQSAFNIFKERTTYSKTLFSSKLSRVVQVPLRQDSGCPGGQICGACGSLINQVDECEIRLMALENELKLKFKMPFPIEVHSRRTDTGQVLAEQPPLDGQEPADQLSFISIDSMDSPAIVLQAEPGENGELIVYGPSEESEPVSYLTQPPPSPPPPPPPPPPRRQRSRHLTPAVCSQCGDVFNTPGDLKIHMACHVTDRILPCRFCKREFATNIALHHHVNEEHPQKLRPCPYCEKRFLTKSNLTQHINTHLEPRYTCELCGRQFRSRGDMRKHTVFRHNSEKNFPCPDCPMSFKVNWLLTRHRVRVHPDVM